MSDPIVSVVAPPNITVAVTDTSVSVVSVDTPITVLAVTEPPIALVALSPDPITVVSAGFGLQGPTGPQGPVGLQGPMGSQGLTGEGGVSGYLAAVPLSGHTVVTLNADGRALPADPTDATHANAIVGISLGAAVAGAQATVSTSGFLSHSGWAFTPGSPVFVGTAGSITQSPPSAVWQKAVGVALSATTIVIELQPAIFQ